MKAIFSSFVSDHTSITTTPSFIKITAISLLTLSLFFFVKHFSFPNYTTTPSQQHHYHLSFYPTNITTVENNTTPFPPPPPPPPSPSPPPPSPPQSPRVVVVERTGIVDENGVMTDDFIVGEFDESLIESVVSLNENEKKDVERKQSERRSFKIEKYKVCDESMSEYVPCMENLEAIKMLNSSDRGEKFERHCPEKGKELNCLVPRPKGYKFHIPWPKSRDEVWADNVPHTRLVGDERGHNWIARKKNKLTFPVGGIQFIHGVDQYLDQISKMVPEIAFGKRTRVALDIGCGVANFGAYLMKRNVIALSVAPKDVQENQIQIALERGVPAMIAAFATRRLLYPSQAFDLVHCVECEVNWIRDDGILLLEVNRILRAGGYFVWSAKPVYNHDPGLVEQWKEMENLTRSLCWELVKKEEYTAIWQKPHNACYPSRNYAVKPSVCDEDDDADNVWYADLKKCISRLTEDGYGANVTTWPERLHAPPNRLFSIKMDAYTSRKELYKADSKFWNDIVNGYVRVFRWKKLNLRNVMDMRAGYGGFAAALHDFQVDCWVMNVVPASGSNTLPVIYDRGLIGVLHDWCEPFDTYPRTYDLLNAAGLFSVEQKRCNISTIMLEMDRILRPGGRVYIRDLTHVIDPLEQIAKAIGWVTLRFDTGEGPHSNWKLLQCEKRL